MEKFVKREEIYKGKVVTLHKDEIITQRGVKAYREVIKHNGGACIALQDDDHKYFMVRQFRYPFNEELLEFCAGKINQGEDHLNTIQRECKEELGYSVKDLKCYGYMAPTCGYSNEKIYLYYGKKNKVVGQNFDEDEDLKVEKYSLEEIKEMIISNKIVDAKTIALAYYLENDSEL